MNRQQLRDYCCRLRGWELTHDDDLSKVDALIDQSLRDISSDAPGALLPSVEHVVLWPDLTNTTEAFTVDVLGTDRYVLEFNNPIVYAGMKTTGEWDGLFWIEVKDPSGVWHRRQVLEFWAQGDPIVFRISIQNPWPNATDADMEWRLYQPFTYTQDDVIDVLGGRSYSAEQQRVTPFPMSMADFHNLTDYQGDSKGPPERLIREGHFQMPSPSNAPTLSISSSDWTGPMNRGTFRVCYTYCWGRRPDEWEKAPSGELGVNDPLWESAPSPIATLDNTGNAKGFDFTTPDPEHELNFRNSASAARDGHSGWYKRFYLARQTVDAVAPGTQALQNPLVETADVFYFLVDVAPSDTIYRFLGTPVYSHQRRLREPHGYWSLRTDPHQDELYEFDLLVRRRHPSLQKDTDVPLISPHGMKALITKVTMYLARLDQDTVDAAELEREYKKRVAELRRTDSAPAKTIEPVGWGNRSEYDRHGNNWGYTPFKNG